MIRKIAVVIALSALAFTANAQPVPPPPATPELPAASAVRPNGTILLIPGRELVIEWKMPEPPTQVAEGAARPHGLPPIPHDPNVETWQDPIPTDNFKRAEPGQIVLSLWVEEGRGTILSAMSGQPQPFFYMANLIERRAGRLVVRPTTICAVRPGTVGLESWPEKVEAIQIVGIGISPADMCYDHEAGKGYKMGEQPPSLAPPPAPAPKTGGAT